MSEDHSSEGLDEWERVLALGSLFGRKWYDVRVSLFVIAIGLVQTVFVFVSLPVQFRLQEIVSSFLLYVSILVLLLGLKLIRDRAILAHNGISGFLSQQDWNDNKSSVAKVFSLRIQLLLPLMIAVSGGLLEYIGVFGGFSPTWSEYLSYGGSLAEIYVLFDVLQTTFHYFALLTFFFLAVLNSYVLYVAVGRIDDERMSGCCQDEKFGLSSVGMYISGATVIWIFGVLIGAVGLAVSHFSGPAVSSDLLTYAVFVYPIFFVPARRCHALTLQVKTREMHKIDENYRRYYDDWAALLGRKEDVDKLGKVSAVLDSLDRRGERLRRVSTWPTEFGNWKFIISILVSAISFVSTLTGLIPALLAWLRAVLGVP